jgi:hypothetical protein
LAGPEAAETVAWLWMGLAVHYAPLWTRLQSKYAADIDWTVPPRKRIRRGGGRRAAGRSHFGARFGELLL